MEVLRQLRENYELVEKGVLSQKDLTVSEQRNLVYAEQRRLFGRQDDYLDQNPNGPYWLKEAPVTAIVTEALHHRDGKQYDLHAYTIMSNHVHMLMTLLPNTPVLYKMMQDLKKFTGLHCNRALHRDGQFWEPESYDHIVRDADEFYRILNYILRNPVKAKLVKTWHEWPYIFCKSELLL